MVFSAFSGAAAVVNGVLIFLGHDQARGARRRHLRRRCSTNGIVGIVVVPRASVRRALSTRSATSARSITSIDRSVLPLLGLAHAAAVARRRHRPGDDEQPLHPVRPGRAAGRQPPAGARPDHAATRLGRARRRRDPRARPDLRPGRAARRGRRRAARSPRSASATSARRPSSGPPDRAAGRTTRSSGRTPGPPRPARAWPPPTRPARTASGRGPGCRSRPTRRPSSSPGSSTRAVPSAGRRPRPATCCSGPSTRWLIWHLTGGVRRRRPRHRRHERLADDADGPRVAGLGARAARRGRRPGGDAARDPLARPRSTATGVGDLAGVPIAGDLGDQQAALFGQTCFEPGQIKCTYGTGCFMLMHTGERPVHSSHGLITTVAARLGDGPATYALEGSVAVAGSLIGWLRDNLGIIGDASEVEALARSVPDSGDVVFVPAFSGPVRAALAERRPGRHRRADALRDARRTSPGPRSKRPPTRSTTSARRWSPTSARPLPGELRVDGGMIRNELLMQFQADILGRPVVAPPIAETSALGRGLRGRSGGRLLARPRRAPGDGPGRPSLGAGDGRGDPGGRDRPLAQGRRADARLGRSPG